VDTLVDTLLDERIAATEDAAEQKRLRALQGNVAVANAKVAYARFRAIFDSERFARLKAQGAHVQRPLWASTGTKNPTYRDVKYIESLIGPDTVNTVPQPTLQAFQDHGHVARTLDKETDAAQITLDALQAAGIDYDMVTQQLEDEGLALFVTSYDALIEGVEQKLVAMK
jgi:transaldolase